jgi:protein-disulfide isomerase
MIVPVFKIATTIMSTAKPTWQVFWDLQCPYSRISWEKLPDIQNHFGKDFSFEIKLTSLVFHPQSFVGHGAACLIEKCKGSEDRLKFINACFQNQEKFLKSAVGDARPSEVDAVFASIANDAAIFDETFTEEYFLAHIRDWDEAQKPAYTEHKEALKLQIYGTPKHVIGDKGLISNSESSWGVTEFIDVLK